MRRPAKRLVLTAHEDCLSQAIGIATGELPHDSNHGCRTSAPMQLRDRDIWSDRRPGCGLNARNRHRYALNVSLPAFPFTSLAHFACTSIACWLRVSFASRRPFAKVGLVQQISGAIGARFGSGSSMARVPRGGERPCEVFEQRQIRRGASLGRKRRAARSQQVEDQSVCRAQARSLSPSPRDRRQASSARSARRRGSPPARYGQSVLTV